MTRTYRYKAKALNVIRQFKEVLLKNNKVIQDLPDMVTLKADCSKSRVFSATYSQSINITFNVPESSDWNLNTRVSKHYFESMEHLVERAIKEAKKTLKALEELRAADAAIKNMTVETVSTGKSKAAAILPSDELNDDDVLSQLSTDR